MQQKYLALSFLLDEIRRPGFYLIARLSVAPNNGLNGSFDFFWQNQVFEWVVLDSKV